MNIAILGHGTVGSGVAEVFLKNRDNLQRKTGLPLDLKYILDVRDFPDVTYADRFVKDFSVIANDDSVKVVAEVIGGIEPAYTFTKTCLERGKSVVTSNKELVAERGAELLAIARENHVNYLFEASVGGGIPIIRPLHTCLAANEINEIIGILNGTTNFILTKMFREQMSFDDALALAQKLGYAERDPSADVQGGDACRKICILSSLSFGEQIFPEDVYTQGITQITPEDVSYAADWGGVIKLIGRAVKAKEPGGNITAMVSPAFVGRDSQLGTVEDVFNAILVRGDATGDVVFYGKGAGKLPTASAVVADIVECAKAVDTSPSLYWKPSKGGNVAPREDNVTAMYFRLEGDPHTLRALVRERFGPVRELHRDNSSAHEYAFVTPALSERELEAAAAQFKAAGAVILGEIRVLDI